MKSLQTSILVLLLGLLQSCSGDSTTTIAKLIGPSGGEVSAPDGITVSIPAGALTEEIEITIREIDKPGSLSGINLVGAVYEFGPAGTTFAEAVTIQVPYEPSQVQPDSPQVRLIWADTSNGPWEVLPGLADEITKLVSGKTTHFSPGVPAGLDEAVDTGEFIQCESTSQCPIGHICVAGVCMGVECQPDCSGKECGDDGCGGSCSPGCDSEHGCVDGSCEIVCTIFNQQSGGNMDRMAGCLYTENGTIASDCSNGSVYKIDSIDVPSDTDYCEPYCKCIVDNQEVGTCDSYTGDSVTEMNQACGWNLYEAGDAV